MVQLFVPKLSPSFQDSDSSLKIEYPYEHEKQGVCPTILRPVQRFVGVQPALQLNDSDLMKEPAYTATIIQDIITGGITEPDNFRNVAQHPERDQWLLSMGRERATLEERGTWELVPRSSIGRNRPVRCKYVYRKKLLKDGSIQFKSRLVACGYSQVAGVDYSSDETYAGVCSYSSLRFLMSLVCQKVTFYRNRTSQRPISRAT